MPPSPAQARLAEFLETAERLKNERAAAGNVLETVEATPPEAWPSLAVFPNSRRMRRSKGWAMKYAAASTVILAKRSPWRSWPRRLQTRCRPRRTQR